MIEHKIGNIMKITWLQRIIQFGFLKQILFSIGLSLMTWKLQTKYIFWLYYRISHKFKKKSFFDNYKPERPYSEKIAIFAFCFYYNSKKSTSGQFWKDIKFEVKNEQLKKK